MAVISTLHGMHQVFYSYNTTMPHYVDTDNNSVYFFDYTPVAGQVRPSLVQITQEEAEAIQAANLQAAELARLALEE